MELKKTIGIVSQKINNKSTGEQSYIITDKYTPPTASISERNKVKELTILYKGSTAPANGNFNVPKHPDYKDVRKDWLSNDIPTAIQITNGGGSTVTPQLKTSAETLKQTMNLYPNAQIYVYGHSLGSMNAQYAIADLDKKRHQTHQRGLLLPRPEYLLQPNAKTTRYRKSNKRFR